jgi:hypothetical protein
MRPFNFQIVLCNLIRNSVSSDREDFFLKRWLSKIDDINIETKKVRKLQFECSLLNHFNSEKKKRIQRSRRRKKCWCLRIKKICNIRPRIKIIYESFKM